MARGAVRGAMVAWLGLITLEVVTSSGGSGKVAGALGTVNDLIKRAISPDVPLIPDHSKPAAAASSAPAGSAAAAYGIDPNSPTAAAQLTAAQGAAAALGARGVGQVGLMGPNLTTYVNGAAPARNQR